MHKHAFLIMAHNEFSILIKLLSLLDDERNDIYLHIDKKANNVPSEILSGDCLKNSILHIIPSQTVIWGGYSQIECELRLLSTAVSANTPYEYYHFISGCDLPLHDQNYIHSFFKQNYGIEFVGANDEWANEPRIKQRYSVYHFFQNKVGRKKSLLWYIDRILVKLQIPFVSRCRGLQFSGGPNWFSITEPFAEYILEKGQWISHTFRYTLSGDEHVIQTILKESPFSSSQYKPGESVYLQCMRYADFTNKGKLPGSPKTLEYIDAVSLLGNPKYIFARKFSTENEENVKAVTYIYDNLMTY